MRLKYHRQIVKMLYDEWDLGKTKSGAKGRTCAWIYWFEILGEAERMLIEKRGGRVIGVCGYAKWGSRRHLFRKRFYKVLAGLLMWSFLVKDKRAMEKYLSDYDYAPKEFEGYFDGEVAMIIVGKKWRGRGIGEGMLARVFELARADGMKKLQILTDESCNFRFYEKMGCRRVYEVVIPNGEPGKCGERRMERGFIYEKGLGSNVGAASVASTGGRASGGL